MPIKLSYQNDDGDDFNLDGYILHPHNLLETWIVLTNPTVIINDEESEVDIFEFDLNEVLEYVYNQHLPGLRVLSSR